MFPLAVLLFAPPRLRIAVAPPARLRGDVTRHSIRLGFTNLTGKPLAVTTFYASLSLDLCDLGGKRLSSARWLSRYALRGGPLWSDLRFVPPYRTTALEASFFPFDDRVLPGKYVVRGSFTLDAWPKGSLRATKGKVLPGGPYPIGPTVVELR